MTPIEIFEYKKRWQIKNSHHVRLHSDLRSKGKDFCKEQLLVQQWDFKEYTNNYEDTYLFEYKHDAQKFNNNFDSKFINQ